MMDRSTGQATMSGWNSYTKAWVILGVISVLAQCAACAEVIDLSDFPEDQCKAVNGCDAEKAKPPSPSTTFNLVLGDEERCFCLSPGTLVTFEALTKTDECILRGGTGGSDSDPSADPDSFIEIATEHKGGRVEVGKPVALQLGTNGACSVPFFCQESNPRLGAFFFNCK